MSGRRHLLVHRPGPLCTVQDLGRPSLASMGVSPSGAADRAAHRLANALVGNPAEAAALEVTMGGLQLEAEGDLLVALAGARCPDAAHLSPILLRSGDRLQLGVPTHGLRTVLAVRGGIDVPPVLGSRCTDVLSGLGPEPVTAGSRLPVGVVHTEPPGVEVAPVPEPSEGVRTLPLLPGPRREWFDDQTWARLTGNAFTVTTQSNRVGVRLEGPQLTPNRTDELPSEGLLRGAIQVPPSGQPIIFLADHPVTGGYPVIAYVTDATVDACAQLRPGQPVRFAAA